VDTVRIIVENSELEVLIPNAFSPNNDGVNDVFQIVNAESFNNIEMSIYNRWGELIHQGSGMNHGWDGTYSGKNQAVGVYIFYARATSTLTNETFILKGSVSLIR
jgi:gliding motility-associated-like protein